MAKLTIIIDHWGHVELKEYLLSLKGISEVIIKNEEQLNIHIEYNHNLISHKLIKMEIILFLDIKKTPSIIAFDKHSTNKTSTYEIVRNDICCEYCLKGAIEDLFEIEGIDKVESNINLENYYQTKYDERDTAIIKIKYNPQLISHDDMKKIELTLNI